MINKLHYFSKILKKHELIGSKDKILDVVDVSGKIVTDLKPLGFKESGLQKQVDCLLLEIVTIPL